MANVEYFEQQAKNLFEDYETKTRCSDDDIYEYNPKHFDMNEIVCAFDIDEDNFTLMDAQDIIAYMAGFEDWENLLKATEIDLEFAKLLFDNRDKINVEDWEMYIAGVENDNNTTFDTESKIEIFKKVWIEECCKNL